jgi:outer membrane protein TolC
MSEIFKSNRQFGVKHGLLAGLVLALATAGWAGTPPGHPNTSQNSTTATNAVRRAVTNAPPWAPAGPITLDQALRRALESDSQIATLRAAVEVARQQRLAATDLKDPVVQGESRAFGRDEEATTDDLDYSRIGVGLPVPNPWLMVPRVDARTADYQAARADLDAAVWLVKCDVRQLFAQLDFLTNDLAFSTDQVRLNGEVLNAMEARLKQGATTASDLMTASRQYVQFQDELDQTFHRYQLARRQLALRLDLPPGSFELATDSVAVPGLPEPGLTFEQAEAIALRSRGDLAALRWRAQAAVSDYHEVRNEAVPWIKELKAGAFNDSDHYWVGLSLEVPIFTWTKNHTANAAQAKAALAAVGETNGVKLVRQELHEALDEVDQTRRQADRNEINVKPLLATMQQALAALKSAPDVMPDQVAAAELQLVETLRLDLNTRWQYRLAVLELERTLGAPLSEVVGARPGL